MKCQIPEISWHNRDPVLSVDVQPKNVVGQQRLASGGTDSHVLVWYIRSTEESDAPFLEVASDLTRHQRAVNVVRWSPNGELLASGDDESVILIWRLKADSEIRNICETENRRPDKETWITLKILRGHMEDVYDLSWAPDSMYLLSASVDNTAIVWDVNKGKSSAILQDSKGFVQGVAWDPKNIFLATLSSDRCFRVYSVFTRKLIGKSNKCILPVPTSHPLHGESYRLYHDDTLQTFFRRCSFSPDGAIVVVPAGVLEGAKQNATYIYARNNWKTPTAVLPSDQYTVATRFCPLLFKLRHGNASLFHLPYRMIFAVATKSSVYLYDTQQKTPFAIISNIHYTRLTDLTWSPDGRLLIVSSTDGFCSLISFEENELGVLYCATLSDNDEVKENDISKCIASQHKQKFGPKIEVPIDKIFSVDEAFPSPVKNRSATPIAVRRKPREADSIKAAKNNDTIRFAETDLTQDIQLLVEDDETNFKLLVSSPKSVKESKALQNVSPMSYHKICEIASEDVTQKPPRRVEFRTISTPKSKKKLLKDA